MILTGAEAAKRVCHYKVNERECKNLNCIYDGTDGQMYECKICLLHYFVETEGRDLK